MVVVGTEGRYAMILELAILSFFANFLQPSLSSESESCLASDTMAVRRTDDFEITGDGEAKDWLAAKWTTLPQQKRAGVPYETRAKMMYSVSGLYLLFFCEDRKITATMQGDFNDLWNEDVIEVFLQPNSTVPAYFEYELSPLNFELPIVIFNEKGSLNSWIPFHYEKERKTRHKIVLKKDRQGQVQSWTAEMFIPYALLTPVMKEQPKSGTRWRGNLNRIDYDEGEALWAWQRNSGDFHEYDRFGIFQFE